MTTVDVGNRWRGAGGSGVVSCAPSMHRARPAALVLAVASAFAARPFAQPGDDPVAIVRSYFAVSDSSGRAALASRLAAHRDYRPSRLRDWIHQAAPFSPQDPGPQKLTVDIGAGESREVFLFVPAGYRPDRAWPLIYALHPSGQPAEEWGNQMQHMLGTRAREFLIASPEYRQNYVFALPPFVPEHPAILDAVARRVHVDADRVYPFGYSKGGFGAWFVSLYYPDRVAGAISMSAGFDVAPADDGFWKLFVQNIAHIPTLNTWGERDTLVIRGLDEKPIETFAESNRRFEREVRGMRLPIISLEVPGGQHNQLAPPPEAIVGILATRRKEDPARVTHSFRHLHQASCYWLEGLSWVGEQWGDPRPALLPARDGESEAQVIARTLEPMLGRLTGEIDGQMIRVTRRHIGDVVIWLGDRTIDWSRPIVVEVDGKTVFSGRVARDASVALARAAMTMDFEALRFAGLRVRADGQMLVVTAATMPEPVWRTGLGR